MERFLIISTHTPEGCNLALHQMLATGFITHFDWGCDDGEHTGWAIIEAESANQAMLAVPTSQRSGAKAIKLRKFSVEEIKKLHLR